MKKYIQKEENLQDITNNIVKALHSKEKFIVSSDTKQLIREYINKAYFEGWIDGDEHRYSKAL